MGRDEWGTASNGSWRYFGADERATRPELEVQLCKPMNWFKDNVYIAAWLALPVMVIVPLFQGRPSNQADRKREPFPIKKTLTYLLFLICFPITLTPWVEPITRLICGIACIPLFLLIVYTSDKEWTDGPRV